MKQIFKAKFWNNKSFNLNLLSPESWTESNFTVKCECLIGIDKKSFIISIPYKHAFNGGGRRGYKNDTYDYPSKGFAVVSFNDERKEFFRKTIEYILENEYSNIRDFLELFSEED